LASFNVTVIVEVVLPSAVTDVGEAATADCAAVTGPTVNVTVAVAVTVTLSEVSVAVKTSAAAVVDFTVKVALPELSVVPCVVVMVGLPEPEVLASVTVLPDTGLLLASFNVTVIVEVVLPFAVTDVGVADTVDCAAVTGPTVNVTVAVAVTVTVSVVSVAVKTSAAGVVDFTVKVA
jgi:predicted transglutaminase-like cysteine proteinase